MFICNSDSVIYETSSQTQKQSRVKLIKVWRVNAINQKTYRDTIDQTASRAAIPEKRDST